jgi:hypothetical protein
LLRHLEKVVGATHFVRLSDHLDFCRSDGGWSIATAGMTGQSLGVLGKTGEDTFCHLVGYWCPVLGLFQDTFDPRVKRYKDPFSMGAEVKVGLLGIVTDLGVIVGGARLLDINSRRRSDKVINELVAVSL